VTAWNGLCIHGRRPRATMKSTPDGVSPTRNLAMEALDFAGLIARVKDGDESAIRLLIERYGPQVQIMVRRRLPARIRNRFDTVDFTQDVWSSVIADCRERDQSFDEPGHLLGFLAGVVNNKVNEEYRRLTRTKKYDLAREQPLYVRRGDRDVPRPVAATDATPSEVVQAGDRFDQIVAGRSPMEIRIVGLRRDGLTYEEIALQLGLHEKAVRRVIESLRARWESSRCR
jgi:RNA polymerase sigma factor (sigma-70 family)